MRIVGKVSMVVMILAMWFSFASCDDEFVEDTNSPEIVEPGDDDNNGEDSDGEKDEGGDDDSNNKDEETGDENRTVIENMTFTETVTYYGHEYDSLVIRNCTFENITGEGLILGDVDEVIVEGCTFRNITGNAVRFATTRTSNNIRVEGNEIYDIDNCGILTQEGHVNVQILNNKIYRTALDPEKGPHGIYLIGENFHVEGNTIYDIGEGAAAGITSRTYGTLSRNKIYNVTGSGIDYSCDHPGFNGSLLIENNIIYDNDRKGIHIMGGPNESHIGEAIIRFNTIVSSNDEKTLWVDSGYYMEANFEIYGNILINTKDSENCLFVSPQHPAEYEAYNLLDTDDVGFVDFQARNLHISASSDASKFNVEAKDCPDIDFDGNNRSKSSQNVGADEI